MNIRDRIAKLLALSESPNEHEAKAALLKARELMATHKLRPEDVLDAKEQKVIRKTIRASCTKMTNKWAVELSAVIAPHYCCKAYYSRIKRTKTATIGFIGLEDDYEVCSRIFLYAYDYILAHCQELRQKYKKIYSGTQLRELCNAYGAGFAAGLYEAFQSQNKQHEEDWGLVLTVPQEVEKAAASLRNGGVYANLNPGNFRNFSAQGYEDGKNFHPETSLEQTENPTSLCG